MTKSAGNILGSEQDALGETDASSHKRIVDHWYQWIVNVLTALGFAVPVAGYFWFLNHFSVDDIVIDQWTEVDVIRQSYVHFFPWDAMWVQANENRIFFQNVIVVLLAHTVHFNVRVEEYLGAVFLAVATLCILWAHKRRSPSTPWLYYCPVAFLAFSVVQEGNTIWGFQVGWYLVLLSLAAAILLLDRVALTWVALLGALAAAAVGSFSSLHGLLIWPTGLVLLYFRRSSLSKIGVWIAGAVASSVLYFRNFNFNVTPDRHFASQHPLVALKFFVLTVGDVVGKPIGNGTFTVEDTMVMLFGIAVVLLAILTVVICGVRRDERSGSPVGIALICYGLMFAAMVTQGRIEFGYQAAGFSRYTTFDLLTLVGIYLALLGHSHTTDGIATSPAARQPSAAGLSDARRSAGWLDRVALPSARVVVLVAILVQIPFGLYSGVKQGRVDHAGAVEAASVLRNIDKESASALTYYLCFFEPASWVRERAHVLEEHHLSVFAAG